MAYTRIHGVYTALITPFTADLMVDYDALHSIVEQQIEGGVAGLVILGSTAEAQTLSMKEKCEIMDKVQEQVAGRIPVIVGAGTNNTQETIRNVIYAAEKGFDGVLLVAPYYNKPTQEGLYQHYLAISEAVDIPQIIYNVPGRTGININVDTQLRIAYDCENVVGVKEASGDIEQIMNVIKDAPKDFAVMSGDDSLAVPCVLMGADGVISVLSNYAPKMFSECINYAESRKVKEAAALHYALYNLMNINVIETNPVPVKAIMQELGLIPNSVVRQPLVSMSEHNLKNVKNVLKRHNIC